jgi:hypothetical protein
MGVDLLPLPAEDLFGFLFFRLPLLDALLELRLFLVELVLTGFQLGLLGLEFFVKFLLPGQKSLEVLLLFFQGGLGTGQSV